MNKTIKTGLALAIGLAGCTGGEPVPSTNSQPYDIAQVEASITESMERLQALQIVHADRLVLNLPAEATTCYGVPCGGSTWQKPYDDERARQAPRLAKLVEGAESIYDNALSPRSMNEAEAALGALDALQIVQVQGLVEAAPKNNPSCYDLPCESDLAEAKAQTELNVARIFATVEAAKRNGL